MTDEVTAQLQALMRTPERLDIAEIAELLECGASVNARDDDGNTLLHLAGWKNRADLVELALDYGADRMVTTPVDDAYPQHVAAQFGCADALRAMLRRGMSAQVEDAWHNAPVRYASLNGYVDATRALLEAGAPIHPKLPLIAGLAGMQEAQARQHNEAAWLLVEAMQVPAEKRLSELIAEPQQIPALLTLEDAYLLAATGCILSVMAPPHWQGHESAYQAMLKQLPAITREAITSAYAAPSVHIREAEHDGGAQFKPIARS